MNHTAFIGIGSNIGDRLGNCKKAIESLAQGKGIKLIRASSFYETEPWGDGDREQNWFINCVVEIETVLDAKELLAIIEGVEKRFGRKRLLSGIEKGGPRIVDLDILFFDKEIMETKDLIVPHPLLHKRKFVLAPLNELVPDFAHPILKKPIADLLRQVDDNKKVIHCP